METLTLVKILTVGLVLIAIIVYLHDNRKDRKDFNKQFKDDEWKS